MSARCESDLVRVVVPSLGGTHAVIAGPYLLIAADAPTTAVVAAIARWLAAQRIASDTM